MKLNLGCGQRNHGSDWIHIDCGNYPHLHSHNIVNLPFEENTCDLIYASHVLEYFDVGEALDVLSEWYRVLKPKGIVRLAVPNFEMMARLYFTKEFKLSSFLGPLFGRMIPEGSHTPIYHKTAYDFVYLKNCLEFSGFRDISLYNWKKTEHAQFDDHSQAYLPKMDKENGTLISLNVEGTK